MIRSVRRWLGKLAVSQTASTRAPRRASLGVERLDDRICPTVTYHGGALLQNVEVQGLYLGSNWVNNTALYNETGRYETFMQGIVNSGYMDMLTNAGYGVGRGTFTQGAIDTRALDSRFYLEDADIRTYLQQNITAGNLAAPDANRLYMIYVEPDIVVRRNESESVNNFLGYHGGFTGTDAVGNAVAIHFAIMAYPSGSVHNAIVPGLSQFDSQTKVASHELVEAVTDPEANYRALGWYDDQYNGEIGDLANTRYDRYNGFVVQYQVDQNDRYIFPTAGSPRNVPGNSYNVATFAGAGLWRFDGSNWEQLSTADAITVAVNAFGDVVAAFADGGGTYEYVESSHAWTKITASSAIQVAVDDNGDAVAAFEDAGLFEYTYGGSWIKLSAYNPSQLTMGANGDIAVTIDGAGVWRFQGDGGWTHLSTFDSNILWIDANGDVLGNIAGNGVWRFSDGHGWTHLTANDAVDLGFDRFGNVSAVFEGGGTWVFDTNSVWTKISAADAYTTTFDSQGNLLADFIGSGLYSYAAQDGWFRLSPYDVTLLI
jgi:hypothetical protein